MIQAVEARKSVWLVGYYGNLPSDGLRDYRAYLLAKALIDRGYSVKWWISAFDHTTKRMRTPADAAHQTVGLEIALVPASPYSKNVSLRRIQSERNFGRNFEVIAKGESPPGTIILMEPARFYGDAVATVARRTGARLVLDIIDLWPEFFEVLFPKSLRSVARAAMYPLYEQRNRLVRQAAAVVGVAPDYVEEVASHADFSGPRHVAYWGAHRSHASNPIVPDEVRNLVAPQGPMQRLVAYTGSLGLGYDLDTLASSARELASRSNIRWIVAGAGPMSGLMRDTARELGPERFLFLGLQPADVVDWILTQVHVGLCCYRDGSTVSMPLKAFDYLARGVPLVNSLGRELGRIVKEEGVGLAYAAGNSGSLSKAVVELCTNDAFREACAARAAAAGTRFDAEKQHRGYAEFLIAEGLVPR